MDTIPTLQLLGLLLCCGLGLLNGAIVAAWEILLSMIVRGMVRKASGAGAGTRRRGPGRRGRGRGRVAAQAGSGRREARGRRGGGRESGRGREGQGCGGRGQKSRNRCGGSGAPMLDTAAAYRNGARQASRGNMGAENARLRRENEWLKQIIGELVLGGFIQARGDRVGRGAGLACAVLILAGAAGHGAARGGARRRGRNRRPKSAGGGNGEGRTAKACQGHARAARPARNGRTAMPARCARNGRKHPCKASRPLCLLAMAGSRGMPACASCRCGCADCAESAMLHGRDGAAGTQAGAGQEGWGRPQKKGAGMPRRDDSRMRCYAGRGAGGQGVSM